MMLRLHTFHPGSGPHEQASAHISAAGCLLGSAPDADLPLSCAAGAPLGRIQAVVRLQGSCYEIENLSTVGSVSINGRPLGHRQCAGLQPGDELQIGSHHIKLNGDAAAGAAAPADEAQPEVPASMNRQVEFMDTGNAHAQALRSEAAIAQEQDQEEPDTFYSLLGGPGVIPVGSPTPPLPEGGETHMLADTRPTVLNDEEPLLGKHGAPDDIGAVLGSGSHENS